MVNDIDCELMMRVLLLQDTMGGDDMGYHGRSSLTVSNLELHSHRSHVYCVLCLAVY